MCLAFLCMALALSLAAPGVLYAASITQIFVLHSYSQEYLWTQGQHGGFVQTIAADPQMEALISTEYLDTKRRAYDETYAKELTRHLRLKYAGYKPAAIYVTDDNALLFARDHLVRVFPGVPIFFSGVNDYGVRSSLDPTRFTGVFERKEVGPNIEWLLDVDKNANDLIFIGDGSNTYQAIESELRNELIPYRLRVTFIADKKLSRVLERLQNLPGKYVFLTTLGGMTDENDQLLSLRDIMKTLAHTGRIIISMEDAYVIEGVLGGSVTSGQKQGMNAARLFLAYRHGKPITDLPPILKSPNALIFDDRILQQYGINLPESLRARAVLLHPRLGFYEHYRSLILGGLTGLATLLLLVVTGALVVLARKNRELSLARNSAESANALFNQLADQSRTVHWEVNGEGLYTYVSPVSISVLGYRSEELVNKKHFYDLLPEEERDTVKTSALEFLAQKKPFHDLEKATRTKDGRLIWVLTNDPLMDDHGTFLGYRGSDCDITERRRAEQALRESEARFKAITMTASDAILLMDDQGKIIHWNPAAVRTFGYSADEAVGKDLHLLLAPRRLHEDYQKGFSGFVMTGQGPVVDRAVELDAMRKDGTEFPIEVSTAAMNIGGKWYALGIVRDITERKREEEEQRQNQEKIKRFADEMSIIAEIGRVVGSTLDVDEVFKRVDAGLSKVISYDRFRVDLKKAGGDEFVVAYKSGVESLRRKIGDAYSSARSVSGVVLTTQKGILVQPSDPEEVERLYPHFYAAFKRGLRSAMNVPLISKGEVIGSMGFRSSKPKAYTERDLQLVEKIGMQIAGAITNAQLFFDRKQAEEENGALQERLHRSEKMEALGQLAGGVAHDLNNVLGVSTIYSEMLQEQLPEGSALKKYADSNLSAMQKAAAIIEDLLTLARRSMVISEMMNLNMEKVVMNLISNASDAISGEGEVTIRTENRYLDKPIGGYAAVREGEYAMLIVSDTGMGISAENMGKIFEPFFTKKTMGRSGTGLGLAIVWGTVKDHDGYIDVTSREGEGTIFTLYFPVTREVAADAAPKIPVEQYMGHGESVLVVDDVAEQRQVATIILTKLGYQVNTIASGEEAVEYLKRDKAEILVLDMIMTPGIDGLETYRRVLEVNPKQKAIIVSGFSETDRVKEAQKLGAGAYVKKPYIMERIGVAIRAELNRK